MDICQLMTDILVNVSCKFEMYILKIAKVINENVCIAFLYVLSMVLVVPYLLSYYLLFCKHYYHVFIYICIFSCLLWL